VFPELEFARLVNRLLEPTEREWVEYKRSWFEPHGVGKYCSALANAARIAGQSAGYLIWGVDDDGRVVGTSLDPPSKTVGSQPFEFWMKRKTAPDGHDFDISVGEYDGHRLVVLRVAAADRVPVRFEGTAYIRVGPATPKLENHPDKERRLMQLLVETTFDRDVARDHATPHEVLELLDVDAALRLLERRAAPPEDRDEALRQLQRHELLHPAGGSLWNITNAAAVLFARRLDEFGSRIGRKAPRVIFYKGDSRVEARFEQAGAKGYAVGFEGLVTYLESHLPRSEQLRGVLRRDLPLFPADAIRELVANALIHQDFAVQGAGPLVEVFDNRLEISNPGSPLIEVDRLIDEPPRSRNERLAHLMRLIGFCEERGSGIDKVIFAAEFFQLPAPSFAVKTTGFVATLFAPRTFNDMTPEERVRACYQHASLLWVSGDKRMTNATLRARFGLPDDRVTQISRLLSDAVDAGVVKPVNQSRAQAAYLPYWA